MRTKWFSRASRTAALGLVLAGGLCSLQDSSESGSRVDIRLERGRAALESGDLQAARKHLGEAWVLSPKSPEVARLMVQASALDPESRALWARTYLRVTAGADGRSSGSKASGSKSSWSREMQEWAPGAAASERARALAYEELQKLSQKQDKLAHRQPSAALVARWARGLAAVLAEPAPALDVPADFLDVHLPVKLPDQVIAALFRAQRAARGQSRLVDCVAASRVLSGLAVQGGFKDLKGDRPRGLKKLAKKSAEALSEARRRLAKDLGEPLTLDELYDMEESETRAFTKLHRDMSRPGLSVTPRGWYRVESSCGWETLVGVTRTLEAHHQRLANWFGEDPFVGRPGLVRVVPEAAGLESEGTPFWWAGGFQGGDTTVMRFSCGNIEGLGHGLTHELTHRFDGVLFPGQPAWLVEGKAVWTGAAYGDSMDEAFVERHILFGTVEAAWIKGYGKLSKLRELIQGEIEEYRDNYVAGYALFVYLGLWEEEGQAVFASALPRYMQGCAKHGGNSLEWFLTCFADGGELRPEGLEEFAAGFASFGKGFYWDARASWTSNYVDSVPQTADDWVYDEPTWVWSRSRAEPWFGQEQAWRAGLLLASLGQTKDAVAAIVWAAARDERSPARDARCAELLAELGRVEAAWVLNNELMSQQRRAGEAFAATRPASLRLPQSEAFLTALLCEAQEFEDHEWSAAAAAVRADHDGLARILGVALAGKSHSGEAGPEASEERLGIAGWVEEGLTGYEERRAKDCWYLEHDGELHVGRFRPKDSSGSMERNAANRHAFCRTEALQHAGRYLIRCRIQFTTSYVSGALVFGYRRRDRNLRLGFSAGDFYYSIGKAEEAEALESVSWSFSGLRERDGPLKGSLPRGHVTFDEPRSNFELAVIVDGATVHIWIEKQFVGTYQSSLGAPITGAVGFATSMGAMRVIDARVQRLDRGRELGRACSPNAGGADFVRALDFERPARGAFTDFVNQRILGLHPASRGQVFVWVPIEEHKEPRFSEALDECARVAQQFYKLAGEALESEAADLEVLLAVPELLGPKRLATLEAALAELEGPTVRILLYAWAKPDSHDLEEAPGASKAWLGLVDSSGVLRTCERLYRTPTGFQPDFMHWLRVFKDHAAVR